MTRDVNSEMLDRSEALVSKLDSIERSSEYIEAMLAVSQYQKDNFEMMDRSLAMMQAVHKAELQNNGFYVDIIKFLTPIFTTATITGAAVDTPALNSSTLLIAGASGLVLSFVTLIPLLLQRHKKARRQSKEYEKLSESFSNWKKIADLRKKLREDPDFNPGQTKEIFGEIMELADLMELKEK